MYPFLYKYFLVNKRVGIPGLGTFALQEIPASLDFVKGVLHSPQSKIIFTKSEDTRLDNNLFIYLGKEMKLEEWQVAKKFQEFTVAITSNISSEKAVELPGIGKLQRGYDDDIFFIPDLAATIVPSTDIKLNNTNDSRANLIELYSTGEHLILTEESEDDKLEMIIKHKEEDYWWVYALILALMGIGALLYYYI
jgi:nucleoid DNA-binding protein